MIVADTSALIAILFEEPLADACLAAMQNEPEVLISAGTLAEAYVVCDARNIGPRLKSLVLELKIAVGKGRHRASLNYGDCFSYAAAKHFDCPLLFIGNDFSQTDIRRAL